MACGYYAILLAYVRGDRVFTRVARGIESTGARIEYLDEASRRIVADVPLRALDSLAGMAGDFEYATVELKASCRTRLGPGEAARALARAGFRVARAPGSAVAYGVVEGRLVEVEVGRGRVRVKLGAARERPPPPPVPKALFALSLEEALRSREVIRKVAREVLGLLEGSGVGVGGAPDRGGPGEAAHSAAGGQPRRPGEGEG